MKVFESSTNVRDLLGKVTQQETGATDLLFQHCMERMRVLAHRLFQSRKDLHLFEESDDLLQKTLVRLHRAIHVLKPSTLLEWAHFHDAIEKLPQEERETLDLIYYGGLSQEEAAEMLGVSTRTIKRRWRLARILLARALDNEWPSME